MLFSTEIAPKEKKRRMGLKERKGTDGRDQAVHRKAGASSISFVPGVAGLMIAGEVIKDLIGMRQKTDRK